MKGNKFIALLAAAAARTPVAAAGLAFGFGRAMLLAAFVLLFAPVAGAAPLRIVAIGASNTYGWLISDQSTYPAVLQRMLREQGVDAEVINAGVVLDTTSKMLARLDFAVPEGTDIVILQPGGNDLRFFGSKEQRAANIETMTRRLEDRAIKVIVYDEEIPRQYVWDGIHFTPAGHTMIATALLPRVMALISRRPDGPPAGGQAGRP